MTEAEKQKLIDEGAVKIQVNIKFVYQNLYFFIYFSLKQL